MTKEGFKTGETKRMKTRKDDDGSSQNVETNGTCQRRFHFLHLFLEQIEGGRL